MMHVLKNNVLWVAKWLIGSSIHTKYIVCADTNTFLYMTMLVIGITCCVLYDPR